MGLDRVPANTPQTLNPKLETATLNPKPEALYPKSKTLNPEPETQIKFPYITLYCCVVYYYITLHSIQLY